MDSLSLDTNLTRTLGCLNIPNSNTSRSVCLENYPCVRRTDWPVQQEIGFTHMRILEGVGTLIQLAGLAARLCKVVCRQLEECNRL